MPRLLTAADIIPLVASLTDTERIHGSDASVYALAPPTINEFSADDDPMARESDGWKDQDFLDLLRSRKLEQDVLDILDEPSPS